MTRKFLDSLPFTLTDGQLEAIRQISSDMADPRPMNRLLQGDVGSGKTVVALYALLIAAENGYQGALMAPTEILAEQHFINHSRQLQDIGAAPALLTSSIKGSDRDKITSRIRDGEVRIVFGTHALIEEGIAFHDLGLAVIDEQHRFGVMQRAALVNKGASPDFLVLSATPIPRTLALTIYGDLDISTLPAKPPGRGEVSTKIVSDKDKAITYRFIKQQLGAGRQAFVICPLIERSEKLDLRSVNEVFQEISCEFGGLPVGVIHGRLPTRERMDVMQQFRAGDLKMLVATTVIEVGVDIPNATLMLIQHPERFGLAQLHQLRGRIGRGAERSYCFLFLDRFVPADTYERIVFFTNNNDGFALAKKDMMLRGPGEILGKRQHGLPDIKFGDIENDQDLLFAARDDAFDVINRDPGISSVEHGAIRNKLQMMSDRERLLGIG
jgi:ATP-dependent DNA helicase RecG